MDKYIIKGNIKELALKGCPKGLTKVHLYHNIITLNDIMNYILEIFAKLLVIEYDAIIDAMWKHISDFHKLQLTVDDLHKTLDDIELVFVMSPRVAIIEPSLLLIILQQSHKQGWTKLDIFDGYYNNYKSNEVVSYHGVQYDILMRRVAYLVAPANLEFIGGAIIDIIFKTGQRTLVTVSKCS